MAVFERGVSLISGLRRYLRRVLPRSIRALSRGSQRSELRRSPDNQGYQSIRLSAADIQSGKYKNYLGGGGGAWDQRGLFQLHLLKLHCGLVPTSRVLDVGCGPGRGSRALVRFLDAGHYVGVDYNADFLRAAAAEMVRDGLGDKGARFEAIHNFGLTHLRPEFDLALVFSVLNHCTAAQRRDFFLNISGPLLVGAHILITHAQWFDVEYLDGHPELAVSKWLNAGDLDVSSYGWAEKESPLPILVLTRGRGRGQFS